MNSLNCSLIHSCQVLRDTGTTQNAAGSPIHNYVPTSYNCFFSNLYSNGKVSVTDAGEMIYSSIMVFLPSSATVDKGDLITTVEPHWEGTYKVQDINVPEDPFAIDHIEAFLSEVAKRD